MEIRKEWKNMEIRNKKVRNPRRLKCGSMNLDGYSKIRDMEKYGNIAKIQTCKIEILIPHNSEFISYMYLLIGLDNICLNMVVLLLQILLF